MPNIPMIAFVAPAAALAGVAMGPYITNRVASRAWIRERRADACAEMLRCLVNLDRGYWRSGELSTEEMTELLVEADVAVEVATMYCDLETIELARRAVIASGDVLSMGDDSANLEEALSRVAKTRQALTSHLAKEIGRALPSPVVRARKRLEGRWSRLGGGS